MSEDPAAPRTVVFSAPDPAAGHCQPTLSQETPGYLHTSDPLILLWGHCSFLLGSCVYKFCLCPPRVCFLTPVEYYSVIKIFPFVTLCMDLKGIILRKIIQKKRENTVCYYIYVEYKNIKKKKNDHNKQKQTQKQAQRKQTSGYQWEKEGGFSKIGVGD